MDPRRNSTKMGLTVKPHVDHCTPGGSPRAPVEGGCLVAHTQDWWVWMINQQWPWFVFKEFLFEMYLDLDILLGVDLHRKESGTKCCNCFEGSFMWSLDFKAMKPGVIIHLEIWAWLLRKTSSSWDSSYSPPILSRTTGKHTVIFLLLREVFATWHPFTWGNSYSDKRKPWGHKSNCKA